MVIVVKAIIYRIWIYTLIRGLSIQHMSSQTRKGGCWYLHFMAELRSANYDVNGACLRGIWFSSIQTIIVVGKHRW